MTVIPWTFPAPVKGWFSLIEGQTLANYAAGRRCLEIGAFCGKSTICMAQTAAEVITIDPLDGRSVGRDARDTEVELLANLREYGVRDKVRVLKGTTEEHAPHLAGKFGLIFIDGDHHTDAVALDVKLTLPLLEDGGIMAFHDGAEPGPAKAIAGLKDRWGFVQVACANALVVLAKVNEAAWTPPPTLFKREDIVR